jgi:hypothetical protein
MTYGGGETAIKPGAVTAKLVDESGAPAAGQPVFLCGLDICSAPKVTGADGTVTISTDLVMKRPALKLGDALHYAELALPVGAAPTDFTLGGKEVLTTGKLLGKPGAVLSAGATATSGDVSLTLAPGTDIGLDGLLYVTPDDQELRAVRIPLDHDAPVFSTAAAPSDFALLYGVAPAETLFCPPARVTVTLPQKAMTPWNDLGWAPGTPVEFWIMTVDTGQFWAPYAGWAKASGGTVSADGHSVTTTDGFPVLENFAIRKAP